jgi:hypothetical protein
MTKKQAEEIMITICNEISDEETDALSRVRAEADIRRTRAEAWLIGKKYRNKETMGCWTGGCAILQECHWQRERERNAR